MGGEYHLPYNFLHSQYKEMEAWKWQDWVIHKPENAVRQTLRLLKMRLPICNYLNFVAAFQGSVMDALPLCITNEKSAVIW